MVIITLIAKVLPEGAIIMGRRIASKSRVRTARLLPLCLLTTLCGQGVAPAIAQETLPWQTSATAPADKSSAAGAAGVQAARTPAPDRRPAKQVFGRIAAPADLAPRAIGFYAKGCLAGARALPVDGPAWQVMRLSRNRNWGHPAMVTYVERLAREVKAKDGWPGLLVGDMAQPRGGPMLTGHASHQIGLDADIWFTPMPSSVLSRDEREQLAATNMLASKLAVDAKVWTDTHVKLIRRAASYPEVERVLVNPAIKKALCDGAGKDREFLKKVRPIWGHDHHFHVRLSCPKGSESCRPQEPTKGEDGCGKELDDWFKLLTAPPKPAEKPEPSKPPVTVEGLPAECRLVLTAAEPTGRTPAQKAAQGTNK